MAPPPPSAQAASPNRFPLPAKIGAGILLYALVAFTYWFIFYSDTVAKIEGAQKQQRDLKTEKIKQEQELASFINDSDELGRCQQRSKEQLKLLPQEAEETSFISTVQTAANASGIDIKDLKPLEEQPQSFYAKVPMRVEVSGRFHQIAKFAYELGRPDADRRIINVENIELSDPKLFGDEVMLKGKCLATAFHTLKAKTEPKAGAPGQAPANPGQPPAAGGGQK